MSPQEYIRQRGLRHGGYADHGIIADRLHQDMQVSRNWRTMHPALRHSLLMIQHKIARILNGDPNFGDHWEDIAGYANAVKTEVLPKICNPPCFGAPNLDPFGEQRLVEQTAPEGVQTIAKGGEAGSFIGTYRRDVSHQGRDSDGHRWAHAETDEDIPF